VPPLREIVKITSAVALFCAAVILVAENLEYENQNLLL
jgi:hypothetical protein